MSDTNDAVNFIGKLRTGFPMDEIARMTMTSRPLLWAWLDGSATPSAADVARVIEIRSLLSEHFGDDVRTAYRVWRSKSRSGACLGGLFAAAFIDQGAVAEQMEVLGSSIINLRASRARRDVSRHAATGRNGAVEDAPSATFTRD